MDILHLKSFVLQWIHWHQLQVIHTTRTKKISAICEKQCQKNLINVANRLKLFLKKNKDELVDCDVDGTWQKRYGHNSKLGATFVLSADTGEVLEYVIKSTYCKEYQYHQNNDIDSEKYRNWKENLNYGINHHGSADALKKIQLSKCFVDWLKNITCHTQSILVMSIVVLLKK